MPGRILHRKILLVLFFVLNFGGFSQADNPTPEQREFFESKIRPVLAENCYRCHSAEKRQRGGLMLDSRETLLKGGDNGPAVVPNHPEKSLLIKAIHYKDPDLRMPPNSKLKADHIRNLEAWVKMGAPWPGTPAVAKKVNTEELNIAERAKHWAFQPMKRTDLPPVKNADWPISPIDHFILAKLEKLGLHPNPPADRRTLIRRVYFDLIGLPPSPQEIEAFVNDDSPKALEKVVNRLLDSPHYGERWGRHWLDLVRFAETAGHEFDFEIPEAYHYRDYVIRAFNADVPYDQFVKEHIAGDLLAKPRLHPKEKFNESIIATGFFHLGESKHAPVDIRSDQADRLDNQIDVFSKTFLALTLSCARCHDHKFDPISTRDYYAMMGYLQTCRYQRAFIDDPTPIREGVKKIHNLRNQLAQLARPVAGRTLKVQSKQLFDLISENANKPQKTAQYLQLRKEIGKDIHHPLYPLVILSEGVAPQVEQTFLAKRDDLLKRWKSSANNSDQYQIFEDFAAGNYDDWFTAGEAFGTGSSAVQEIFQANANRPVRELFTPHVAHSGSISGRLQGTLRSSTFNIPKKYIHYLVRGKGTKINLIIDGFQKIRNPIYGGLTIEVKHGDQSRWMTQNVSMWTGHRAYVELLDDGNGYIGLEKVVFSDNPRPPGQEANALLAHLLSEKSLKTPEDLAQAYRKTLQEIIADWQAGQLSQKPFLADRVAMLNGLLKSPTINALPLDNPPDPQLVGQIEPLLVQVRQTETKLTVSTRVLAMQEGSPVNEQVFIRGNHKNLGETVPRRFLEVFVGEEQPPEDGTGRLQLAQHMVDPANPLTARVMVNRIWKHHFGEGIVKSVDNFGLLGEEPTHPELLDWLATEFIRKGWSIKEMHRLMVLSRTYQMSSRPQAAAKTIDPENKYLHRMPVRRLEGEIIRDALLTISGRLNPKMFGKGVLPHLTPFMAGRGRPGKSGPLDGDGRRSIYINVRRNFLTPMFLVFDYPVPFTTMGRRSVSNVPAQALTMMNNPFVLQQSELWAKKLLAQPSLDHEQRIHRMFEEALGRPPSAQERQQMLAFLQEQSQLYAGPDDPRVWRDLCHVVVNLKEFIFVQ